LYDSSAHDVSQIDLLGERMEDALALDIAAMSSLASLPKEAESVGVKWVVQLY